MQDEKRLSRRTALKAVGGAGAAVLAGSRALAGEQLNAAEPPAQSTDVRKQIFGRVWGTPLIDTHEHLGDEHERLSEGGEGRQDDWTVVLSGYLGSDLASAGMPEDHLRKFYAYGLSPVEKWRLLAPYWPAVKNTGYGWSARIALQQLYGVAELSADTVEQVEAGYQQLRRPGFYRHVLCEQSGIESCQVNYLRAPFLESRMPTLMMQDLSIVGMFSGPEFTAFGGPAGIEADELTDWYRVIDWWFDKYGRYAVAVKSQDAYQRNIDYQQVPEEVAAAAFRKRRRDEPMDGSERKALQDHLFWYAVRKAVEHQLPVKLHTGYYAGHNYMPLSRLADNAGAACELCRTARDATFVFMHICYPYYEDLLAVAKHWTNACVDMCWSWIINPVAAKDFLKKYLVTAPANKILTFGGDYLFVEQVVGHAAIARQGIATALSELVEEGWMSLDDALELVEPILRGNARRIFRLEEKEAVLRTAPWL